MEVCQVKAAIKQFAENNMPQKSLLVTFNGDVKHRRQLKGKKNH